MKLLSCLSKSVTLFALVFFGCSEKEVEKTRASDNTSRGVEMAFPNRKGTQKVIEGDGSKFKYEEIDGHAVFEGDILLSKFQLEEIKQAASAKQTSANGRNGSAGRTTIAAQWPGKVVYYTISPTLPNQYRVTDAIRHWEGNTPIRFIPRTTELNYITFVYGSGCSSYVGMIGGQQNIILGDGCTTGSTIHEIGHAVGLWHEHTRADRGASVDIHWANIEAGRENAFEISSVKGFSEFNNGSFDFYSVMLYSSYAFSRNGSPTVTKKYGVTFGSQSTLSQGDIDGVNYIYASSIDLSPPSNIYARHADEDLTVTWDPVPGATKYYIFDDYAGTGHFELYRIVNTNAYYRELKPEYIGAYRILIAAADSQGNVSRALEPDYAWK